LHFQDLVGILVGGGHVFIPSMCHILDVPYCVFLQLEIIQALFCWGLSVATAQEGGSMQSADSFCSLPFCREGAKQAEASGM
jgi:hypothetical protein